LVQPRHHLLARVGDHVGLVTRRSPSFSARRNFFRLDGFAVDVLGFPRCARSCISRSSGRIRTTRADAGTASPRSRRCRRKGTAKGPASGWRWRLQRKLQREHGFNPLMGCLSGACSAARCSSGSITCLRSFNRTGDRRVRRRPSGAASGRFEQNRATGNYIFSPPRRRSLPGREPVRRTAGCVDDPVEPVLDAFTEFSRGRRHRASACRLMIMAGHRDVLEQPRIDRASEPRSGGEPAERRS